MYCLQGSHKLDGNHGKPGKSLKKSSMHEKIMEFEEKKLNNHGQIMEFEKKMNNCGKIMVFVK